MINKDKTYIQSVSKDDFQRFSKDINESITKLNKMLRCNENTFNLGDDFWKNPSVIFLFESSVFYGLPNFNVQEEKEYINVCFTKDELKGASASCIVELQKEVGKEREVLESHSVGDHKIKFTYGRNHRYADLTLKNGNEKSNTFAIPFSKIKFNKKGQPSLDYIIHVKLSLKLKGEIYDFERDIRISKVSFDQKGKLLDEKLPRLMPVSTLFNDDVASLYYKLDRNGIIDNNLRQNQRIFTFNFYGDFFPRTLIQDNMPVFSRSLLVDTEYWNKWATEHQINPLKTPQYFDDDGNFNTYGIYQFSFVDNMRKYVDASLIKFVVDEIYSK